MINPLPIYAFYLGIGLLEWFLALSRTLFVIRRNKILVPLTVFIENLVGLLVFKNFIEQNDWVIAVCYAFGSAFGSIIPLYIIKKK
jgi:lipid-A-disaccharide synthase-like uncharacterized protein